MAIRHREPGLDVAVWSIAVVALLVTGLPFLYVLFLSVSTPEAVFFNQVLFLPDRIYLQSYADIFERAAIGTFYFNTVFIVAIGTAINLVMTCLAAYPLSRRDFRFRHLFMGFIVFTMFFHGGIIPFYIVVRSLGMVNTRWALIIPFAVAAWHIIITRTYFQSAIPDSLHESALIDGASRTRILVSIVVPLAKPVIAVIALWTAVGFWNTYFWALVFIFDADKQPIQIFLVKLLIQGQGAELGLGRAPGMLTRNSGVAEQMKYVAIVVTIAPIVAVYPFLQRYFIKGVMIGALKG